ncbi:MAG: lytic transglycosylase domain-containing protein [Proteobacteria bacterium]|nr:lytic transglycosylase domain-containing protein [Pseudomonadota bacterium]
MNRLPVKRFGAAVVVACLLIARPPAAAAQASGVAPGTTPMDAVAAHDWTAADALAARYADPVAGKVVTYYRLLTRGQASAAEISAFMQTNPDWPQQALLRARWEQALADEPDQSAALAQCRWRLPDEAKALLRCAQAFAAANDTTDADEAARRAWTGTGITGPADVAAFLSQWGGILRPSDDWARFVMLARMESPAAQSQVTRLAPADQPTALVWVALNADNPDGAALLDALPPSRQHEPGLFLAGARFIRRNGSDPDAYAFWLSGGNAAMAAGLPVQQHALWEEANHLARALLTDGDAAHAYDLVDLIKPPAPADRGEEEFLAGFIALRLLHDPAKAEPHFRALAGLSSAVITQARAHYWLARTLAAEGSTMKAAAEYQIAAHWPTTFYGQLAALALGDSPAALNARILAVPEPDWTTAEALDFAGRDVARAAAYLVAWNEPRRAHNFLIDIGLLAPDPADLAMAAQLGLGFGLPSAAVGIARLAGLHGTMLVGPGWPTPFSPPTNAGVEPAVALSLIRQESSFDVAAESGAGALGLMQLMPATARLVASQQGVHVSEWQLTTDPDVNMRLGTAYFARLLARFGDCLPLAIAGYNAGPNRVDQWLGENGDFRTPGGPDVLDWIELIPFDETRNYVERVVEGIAIYRAKEGQAVPYPLQPWLH